MPGLFIAIIGYTALLAGSIWIVARRDADFSSWPKMVLVSAGISLGNLLLAIGLSQVLQPVVGMIIYFPISVAFAGLLIHYFIFLSWKQSFITAVIYTVASITFNILYTMLLRS
ncbi:MAG: hypothetical protein AAF585_29665 [Verrucomicrobiota bacterium]